MTWQPDTSVPERSVRFTRALFAELQAPLVVALLALQGALAVLLAARVFAGQASPGEATSSAAGGLLVWSVVSAMLAALARLSWFAHDRRGNNALDAVSRFLPLAAVSLTAISIPLAGAGWPVTVVAWLVLAIEELVVLTALTDGRIADRWARFFKTLFRSAWPQSPRDRSQQHTAGARPQTQESTKPSVATPATILPEPLAPDAPCVQRLFRVQEIDGADRLEGSLSTRFAAGQSTSQIHVAFCPSFARVPALDYRQAGGPSARVKLAQVLPHGARFDVKLSEPARCPLQVTLEIIARHAPAAANNNHHIAPVSAPGESAERSTTAPL